MPADDRDAKFERALEQHLRAGSLAAGCPDEETLAAYHERSLSLEEMAHWKQHIAGCARCQETLALVEVTEKQLAEDWQEEAIPALLTVARQAATQMPAVKRDATPIQMPLPAPKPIKQRPALVRWAIPLGAVAAGVLLWIGIHEQRLLKPAPASTNTQVAENRRQEAPVLSQSEAVPKAVPPPVRDEEKTARNEREVSRLRAPEMVEKEAGSVHLAPPAAADALVKDTAPAKKQAAAEPTPILAGNAPAPPPPPPTKAPKPAPPGVAAETLEASPAAPSAQATGKPVELPPAGVSGGMLDQKYSGAMSKAKSAPAPQAAPQQQAADSNTNAMMYSQGMNRATMLGSLAPGSGVIVTPDNKVWWKIGASGIVALTTDAGKNWKTLATGATSQLTSGSAPSSKICWIAGQAGTLLLTTDRGRHWTSLTSPITGDLGGVHAVDAKHATIWDTANRASYETSDAGVTWKQVANE